MCYELIIVYYTLIKFNYESTYSYNMSQLTMLHNDDINFPPVHLALTEPDGLLAVGGDLTSQRLIKAYQQGIFPWFNEGDPLMWWSPARRCVIYCSDFYVNKSFNKFLKKCEFTITINHAFEAVINHCRLPRKDDCGTWIDDQMTKAYVGLHNQKIAHSVEIWHDNTLVGGLYGVFVNNTFCGESMFSLMPNASKTALLALSKFMQKHDVLLIDCQIDNPHLSSLGAVLIPRREFVSHLSSTNIKMPTINWDPKEITFE